MRFAIFSSNDIYRLGLLGVTFAVRLVQCGGRATNPWLNLEMPQRAHHSSACFLCLCVCVFFVAIYERPEPGCEKQQDPQTG
jgi:hypothetical protein